MSLTDSEIVELLLEPAGPETVWLLERSKVSYQKDPVVQLYARVAPPRPPPRPLTRPERLRELRQLPVPVRPGTRTQTGNARAVEELIRNMDRMDRRGFMPIPEMIDRIATLGTKEREKRHKEDNQQVLRLGDAIRAVEDLYRTVIGSWMSTDAAVDILTESFRRATLSQSNPRKVRLRRYSERQR